MNEPDYQNDPRSTRELVNIALTSSDEDDFDSAFWRAISELHRRGTTEVFEAARTLCESPCPLEQRVGCQILSQLGCTERPFAAVSFPFVAKVLQTTENVDTLASAICALGWLEDLKGVDLILPYLDHVDSNIRYWVTHSLTALQADQRSIDGLIHLMHDSSVKVRDWATFGLGSLTEQDSPAIRQALIARLKDADDIVRGEALVGLALRQDERVVEPLRQALEAGTYNNCPNDYAREALDALKDLDHYRELMQWKAND